jgi:hypothetical protein
VIVLHFSPTSFSFHSLSLLSLAACFSNTPGQYHLSSLLYLFSLPDLLLFRDICLAMSLPSDFAQLPPFQWGQTLTILF